MARRKFIFVLSVAVHLGLTIIASLWVYLWWAVLGQAAVDSGATATPTEPLGLTVLSFFDVTLRLPLTFPIVLFLQKAGVQDTAQFVYLLAPFNSFLAIWIFYRFIRLVKHEDVK